MRNIGSVKNMGMAAVFVLLALSTAVFAQNYPQGPAQPGGAPQGMGTPQAGQQADPDGADAGPADEPGRAVARLGILNGDASIRRGDSDEWVAATINAPLMSGDQVSGAAGARAEIQLDAAHFLRIAGDTELRLADLENGHFQVQISHGMVTWRVLRDSKSQAEITTPLVAVTPGRQSVVRMEVAADGTTNVTVRHGDAQVSTQKGSEKVAENSTMMVRGSANDPEFQVVAAAARDDWDNWSDQRDSYLARAQAPRYVPQDVTGVEDLDAYGHWSYDPAYGWVWMPTVASSWAPYRDGQWVWEDYYGWTWVDYSPWGWAPFHYGNWYNRGGLGWAWFPGPRVGRVWWRPAMVGFFGWGGGGMGVGFGFGNIGWIPLAPYERFRPWYGRGGIGGRAGIGVNMARNVNISGSFRNAGVANGVTAVSAADFQRGNFRNPVGVDRNTLQQASVARGAVPVTPTSQNLRFSDRTAATALSPRSAGNAATQRFYGSATASAQRTPFAQQQAAVRSAVNGGVNAARPGQTVGQVPTTRQTQSSAPGWQRFQGQPPAANPGAGNMRSTPQSGNPAQGATRFGGAPSPSSNGGAPQNYAQPARPGYSPSQQAQPRQYQVSPPIIRQREAPPQSYSYPQQARPQQAPAPAPQRGNYGGGYGGGNAGSNGGNYGGGSAARSAAPAPSRSAPAGGSRQSAPSHGGGRR